MDFERYGKFCLWYIELILDVMISERKFFEKRCKGWFVKCFFVFDDGWLLKENLIKIVIKVGCGKF